MYLIQDLNNGLFWSNELGWVGLESADRFTQDERLSIPYLPLESKWVTLWEVERFTLSAERLGEIEEDLGDDESGYLIKSSTLKFLIEREVRRALGQPE